MATSSTVVNPGGNICNELTHSVGFADDLDHVARRLADSKDNYSVLRDKVCR